MKKIIILLVLFSAAVFAQEKGTFTDSRDKKTYKTVKIGKQTWMAENLNYNAKGSKCYGNKPANCDKYGKLYDQETSKSVCPAGWHLPTEEEWNAVGEGEKLLALLPGGTYGGNGEIGDGESDEGFDYDLIGRCGFFGKASDYYYYHKFCSSIDNLTSYLFAKGDYAVQLFSVRCLKD